jgi:hypothetical protein
MCSRPYLYMLRMQTHQVLLIQKRTLQIHRRFVGSHFIQKSAKVLDRPSNIQLDTLTDVKLEANKENLRVFELFIQKLKTFRIKTNLRPGVDSF